MSAAPVSQQAPDPEHLRLIEAVLFAAAEPLQPAALANHLPDDTPLQPILDALQKQYEGRGIELVRRDRAWCFRTAADLKDKLKITLTRKQKLSRAAMETLAVIAYHQPVTRSEIEAIRGVSASRGTLDTLMEAGWVKPGRRRETVGRPLTWITTPDFLDAFSLAGLKDLPGMKELKEAGLLDTRPSLNQISDEAGELFSRDDKDE
ncbi:MAG: SMC-Scp complex subunit ScpB [Alphaproteobacteria bacterium]